MTLKEIAKTANITARTAQLWAKKAGEKFSSVREKISSAGHGKPSDFTLPETIAIIRAGGNETLANLLQENAISKSTSLTTTAPAQGITREFIADVISATVRETVKALQVPSVLPALPAPKPEKKFAAIYQDKEKTLIRYDGEEYQVGKSYYNVAFWDLRVKRDGHWHTLKRDFISRAQALRYLERNF